MATQQFLNCTPARKTLDTGEMQTGKKEQYERVCHVYQCLLYKAIEEESAKML